jgi:hypothetical protein
MESEKETAKEFIKKEYGVTLTDEQAEKVISYAFGKWFFNKFENLTQK